MAFIKCPECGKRFSETEHSCPYCGYLLENQQPHQQETQSKDQSKQDCDNQQLNNQQLSSEQDCPSKPDCQHEKECQRQLGHKYLKCSDCGQEYDSELEVCPNCGCPSEYQVKQAEKTPKETEVSQAKSHTPRKGSKNKKLILVVLPIIIIAGIVAVGMIYHHKHSYEYKMARLEKVATDFKETLDPNDIILTERIDSITQKVFYSKKTEETEHELSSTVIMVHDYSTGETKQVLPNSHSIEGFKFCDGLWLQAYKVIKDRLFLKYYSPCMFCREATGVFYVNIRDNTLHFVELCYEAGFLDNSNITIKKHYLLGLENGLEQTKEEQYTLSTSLSDEAYADNRWEQKRKEERLAEEWRKRDIERVIKFDYTLQRNKPYVIDHISSIGACYYEGGVVEAKSITVPKNKVWVFKRFSYSGYNNYSGAELKYYKIGSIGRDLVKDAQVFYPGQYVFYIFDYSSHLPGHRTATIKFSEEAY